MNSKQYSDEIDLERVAQLFGKIQKFIESQFLDISPREKLFSSLEQIPFVPEKKYTVSYYYSTIKHLKELPAYHKLNAIVNKYLLPSPPLPFASLEELEDARKEFSEELEWQEEWVKGIDSPLIIWLKSNCFIHKKLSKGDTEDYTDRFITDLTHYKDHKGKCKVFYALDNILFPKNFNIGNVRTASENDQKELSQACEYFSTPDYWGESILDKMSIPSGSVLSKTNFGYLIANFDWDINDLWNAKYESLLEKISSELNILRLSRREDFSVQNIYGIPLSCFEWNNSVVHHSINYARSSWTICGEYCDRSSWLKYIKKISNHDIQFIHNLYTSIEVDLKSILPKELQKSIKFFSSASEIVKNYNYIPFAFLRLITSLEQILNPNGQIEHLKKNFSYRFDYLTPKKVLRKWGTNIGALIYQFRNDLIHGSKEEVVMDTLTQLPRTLNGIDYEEIRDLARLIILKVLRIYDHINSRSDLTKVLKTYFQIQDIPTNWTKLVSMLDKVYSVPSLAQDLNSIIDREP